MTITEILTDLKAKAKQATPGPRQVARGTQVYSEDPDGVLNAHHGPNGVHVASFYYQGDADQFAACSPDRILALTRWAQSAIRALRIAEQHRGMGRLPDDLDDALEDPALLGALAGHLDAGNS